MTTFKVTYPSKETYVETCDAETVEEFCNRHFGSVDYEEHGITVEIVEEPEAEDPDEDTEDDE